MPGALLIVDFADNLKLVGFLWDRVDDLAALVLGLWKFAGDVQCRFAVQRRIDAIVEKRRGQGDLPASITRWRGERRPVTSHHRRRRNIAGRVPSRGAGYGPLIASEEEELVLQNRSTQRSAKLIALQIVSLQGKEVSSVERVIAHKLKRVAMQLIRARLGDRVDLAARSPAAARSGAAADFHLKLLERIREREWHLRVVIRIVMHGSVQGIHHSELQSASDGDKISCSTRTPNKTARYRACNPLDSGARDCDQVGDPAPLQRQFQNPLVLDDRTHSRAPRFHERGIGLHLDLFGDLTDLQNRVDHRVAVDLQDNSGLYKRTKTEQCRFKSIRTQRQVRQNVGSGLIRDGSSGDARIGLRCCHFHTRQHRPTLISNGAADLRRRLRPDAPAGHRRSHQSNEKSDPNVFH